jgi:hypothetical protein
MYGDEAYEGCAVLCVSEQRDSVDAREVVTAGYHVLVGEILIRFESTETNADYVPAPLSPRRLSRRQQAPLKVGQLFKSHRGE